MKTDRYDSTRLRSLSAVGALCLAFLALLFLASPAAAQFDIPETEGPDLDPPISGPGKERICQLCCTGAPSPECLKNCNCGVAEDPHPCAVAAAVGDRESSSSFQQIAALLTLWDTLDEKYPDHASAYRQFNGRIGKLYARHPRLARRSAKFIAGITLGVLDSSKGKATGAGLITARDLRLLRGVLKELARLDRQEFDGELAKAIDSMISLGPDDSVVGRSPMSALDCVLTAKCAP